MRKSLLAATFATAVIAGGGLMQSAARAAPFGADAGLRTEVGLVRFLFGGRNYCWYDDGWQGPGWYWCGYSRRSGMGWGGGYGWQGARGGHPGGSRSGHAGGARGGGSHVSGHAGGGGSYSVGAIGHAGGGHSGGGGHAGGGGGGHAGGGGAGHAGGGGRGGGGGKKH